MPCNPVSVVTWLTGLTVAGGFSLVCHPTVCTDRRQESCSVTLVPALLRRKDAPRGYRASGCDITTAPCR